MVVVVLRDEATVELVNRECGFTIVAVTVVVVVVVV
jgi:hypothetical protein